KKHSTQVYLGPSKKTSVSNAGQWLYEEKPHKMDLLHENGPRPGLHENVCKAVSDFCKWVTTFGISDIDEEFILKQFDIDYETKPSHDALHTMKLNQVPLELKRSVGLSKLQETEFFQKLGYERKLQKPQVCWSLLEVHSRPYLPGYHQWRLQNSKDCCLLLLLEASSWRGPSLMPARALLYESIFKKAMDI
ncbi:FAM47E-STBD1 readthrough, partial [Homo sapiens]